MSTGDGGLHMLFSFGHPFILLARRLHDLSFQLPVVQVVVERSAMHELASATLHVTLQRIVAGEGRSAVPVGTYQPMLLPLEVYQMPARFLGRNFAILEPLPLLHSMSDLVAPEIHLSVAFKQPSANLALAMAVHKGVEAGQKAVRATIGLTVARPFLVVFAAITFCLGRFGRSGASGCLGLTTTGRAC